MPHKKLEEHYIYAWMGEDECGSGRIGLKQGLVPAGMIPLVAMDYDREKITRPGLVKTLEQQAAKFGKKIRLVRFRFDGIEHATVEGEG